MKKLMRNLLRMAGAGPYTCDCLAMFDTAAEFNAHVGGCADAQR